MAEVFEYRSGRRRAAASDSLTGDRRNELATQQAGHPLDSAENRKTLRMLLQWFYYERDRQAQNRLEMAVDHDFYDNLQWDDDAAAAVQERGQVPLVYNEVAPMCDWIIGTERRNRVDWKVLPRNEDDVQLADVKTKVLKYVSDINKVVFARSRAFADAVKGGIGWVDDGTRDDPTKDILYSGYESWRNVLHDSNALSMDDDDHRYRFRWRWVDEDVACFMFPDRADRIRAAVEDFSGHIDPLQNEDTWPSSYDGGETLGRSGTYSMPLGAGADEGRRRRVKLIECQFRMPARTKIITSGPMKGSYFHPGDGGLVDALNRYGGTIIDKIAMRVHCAVFTETDLLGLGPSVYRHNRYSLTPVWCYRRSRDNMPYGAIRRVRDIQRDLNKRASKALHVLNTNQIVAEDGAFDDPEQARDEAQQPDGIIIHKAGKKVEIRRDTDAATGQMQIMVMDAQSIQKSAGVTDENLGRKTNAISGEAIKARQNQGAVVTTEIFDNLRLSVQMQGEKQLSLVEQFYTEEKVIRLTGARGALEWVKVNVPEQQADGSVRYLNDITASQADFVVSEADYAGTLRQVMFDSMNAIAAKMPDPTMAMRFLTIAFGYSDLPNKDEIAGELRKLTGDRDPTKPMTPEEAQAAQAQMQQQMQAMEVAKATALATLQEQQGKAREINAKAAKLELETQQLMAGGGEGAGDGGASDALAQIKDAQQQMALEAAVAKVQRAAADEIDRLSAQLEKATADQATKLLQIKREADTEVEVANIQADAQVEMARIADASEKRLAALMQRIDELSATVTSTVTDLRKDVARDVGDVKKVATEALSTAEGADKKAEEAKAVEPAPAPAAAAPAALAGMSGGGGAAAGAGGPAGQPLVLMVQPAQQSLHAQPQKRAVQVKFRYSGDSVAGATVKREDGSTDEITIDREGGKP